jgi:hypothetical protein
MCHVNPDHPSKSVLMADVEWVALLLLIIPLPFILFGFIGIRRSIKELRGHHTGEVVFRTRSKWGGIVISSFFLIPGLLFFYFGCLSPLIDTVSAQWWEEVSCTIISSRSVVTGYDSEFMQSYYGPDILYSYQYKGKEYKSNHYDLFGVSASMAYSERIVYRYPSGAVRTCYVNPDKPEEAVLFRGFDGGIILHGLFSLPFIAVGLYLLYRLFFQPVALIEQAVQKVVLIPSLLYQFVVIVKGEYSRIFKKQ